MKSITWTNAGWAKKAQEMRNQLTEDFKAGKLGVENGWLIEYVDSCTCAGGGAEVNGAHENHCGMEPIMDLVPAETEFLVPEDYEG